MTPKPKSALPANRWHAVSIVAGLGSCAAIGAVHQKRFLSIEAPALPLPDCSNRAYCHCRYVKHPDRRTTLRRMTDRGPGALSWWAGPKDRRISNGRRSSDKD